MTAHRVSFVVAPARLGASLACEYAFATLREGLVRASSRSANFDVKGAMWIGRASVMDTTRSVSARTTDTPVTNASQQLRMDLPSWSR